MGNGASGQHSRCVYVDIHGKIEKIIFTPHSSSKDIQETIAMAAGASSWTGVILKDKYGGLVTISPSMASNSTDTPFKVQVIETKIVKDPFTGSLSSSVFCRPRQGTRTLREVRRKKHLRHVSCWRRLPHISDNS
ncbi:hypothetical protein RvY_01602 [Ramazzottius varieornatus]|uniref:Uncharacterized protein n=1 Tax=Ramazzottius varieornatus TaxID=947166 RepID=A0A1D1URL2_RAMVA|nr:hypothetical protein RvY_01602 [Ramazzottius varieornatus]